MSYHTFPRSAIVSQAPGTSYPRGVPAPQLGIPTSTRPVPANAPSHHHRSSRPARHHHSQSLSVATSRHVHYADDKLQPRSRQISAQSSRVPGVAATSHYPHRTVGQQPTLGHRRRAHSTGNPAAPVTTNFAPFQSQRQARVSIGHEYSKCTGRKKALCVSKQCHSGSTRCNDR